MIFSELDIPSVGGTAVVATIIGLLIKAAEMWFGRKDKKEEELIVHFKNLLAVQKKDCDDETDGLKVEIGKMKTELDSVRRELTAEKVARAKDSGRIEYLEEKYKDATGKELKPWNSGEHQSLKDTINDR